MSDHLDGKWVIDQIDGEWDLIEGYDTRQLAINAGHKTDRPTFRVGLARLCRTEDFAAGLGEAVQDVAMETAIEVAGDVAEDWLLPKALDEHVFNVAVKELFVKWVRESGLDPTFHVVTDVRYVRLVV